MTTPIGDQIRRGHQPMLQEILLEFLDAPPGLIWFDFTQSSIASRIELVIIRLRIDIAQDSAVVDRDLPYKVGAKARKGASLAARVTFVI